MPIHDGCMTTSDQLTEEEEAKMTDWLIGSFQTRPQDWTFGEPTLIDAKTGIEVWMNGESFVRIYRPVATNDFRKKFRKRIWREAHKLRHANQGTSPVAKALDELIAKEPAPPPQLEPPWWTKVVLFVFGPKEEPKRITDQRDLA